jgi:hypothetical protein
VLKTEGFVFETQRLGAYISVLVHQDRNSLAAELLSRSPVNARNIHSVAHTEPAKVSTVNLDLWNSCENAISLSMPGIPVPCEKFPHTVHWILNNFWTTESIFSCLFVCLFGVFFCFFFVCVCFFRTLNALCVCFQAYLDHFHLCAKEVAYFRTKSYVSLPSL